MNQSKQAEKVGSNYWIRVVVLFFVGWIFIYGTRTILNPVQGLIAEEFNLSASQIGLANSIFFLTYTFAQVPSGMIGDKFGRKNVIAISFILLGILTYFTGAITSFGMLLLVRALAGISQAGYYGPQYAMSSEALPEDKRTLGNALINSGMAFGTSGGYLLSSSLVLNGGASWSQPFWITAIPTVIVGILIYFILKERVVIEGETKTEEAEEESMNAKEVLSEIIHSKNLLASFFLCFCSIYANFVIITWLPQFLIESRGIEGSDVGFISSLVPWASIPGALFFAYARDKVGSTKKLVNILMPLAAISVFAIAFVENRTIMIIVLILYGLTGKLALDPQLISYVNHYAPKNGLATTLSAYNFVGMMGSTLAPYITGYISDTFGSMHIGFYLGAAVLVVGLLVFVFFADDTPSPQEA